MPPDPRAPLRGPGLLLARILILGLTLSVPWGAPLAGAQSLRFGLALEGQPETPATLGQETGLPVSLVNVFVQWPQYPEQPGQGEFPLQTARAVAAIGATLVLTWEPMYLAEGKEHAIDAADIVAGRYDAYIERFARAAAAWGGDAMLRFAHEMNLERYHWGGQRDAYGPASPARYRLMFRHVVTRVRQAGATKLRFAFCPNVESVPGPGSAPPAAWNTASAWYPGAAVVDVLGMDGYNWGTTRTRAIHGWQSRWQSFAELFQPLRAELQTLAPDKPLYVFETASATQGGDKAGWLREMIATARQWGLAGVIWFQVCKEVDWRLATGVQQPDIDTLRAALTAP